MVCKDVFSKDVSTVAGAAFCSQGGRKTTARCSPTRVCSGDRLAMSGRTYGTQQNKEALSQGSHVSQLDLLNVYENVHCDSIRFRGKAISIILRLSGWKGFW